MGCEEGNEMWYVLQNMTESEYEAIAFATFSLFILTTTVVEGNGLWINALVDSFLE